jgi:hypothetical protein
MKETWKTLAFCLVATLSVVAVLYQSPGTTLMKSGQEQGGNFYPDFKDPQAPKAIEVVDFDEATAAARPLKVEYKNRKWILPSHYGYPADAQQRLAQTAAALIELKKDAVISDRVDDHAKYGVIDPLDQDNPSLTGRGKRVTLRGENGAVLAGFIIGKVVEGKPGFYYLRVPGQPRIYMVKTEAEASARFQDWIETDLLKLRPADVRRIIVNSYSVNESMGAIQNVESVAMNKEGEQWKAGSGAAKQARVKELLNALANLRIVDVQPKPMGLSQELKTPEGIRLSQESLLSLRQKGFFITPTGQLLSNEGELIVDTSAGLQYSLRFGEIAPGSGGLAEPAPAAGAAIAGKEQARAKAPEERRYLFITVSYSAERAAKYAGEGATLDERGKKLGEELRNRFADWYYVISGADFKKIRPRKNELVQ